MDAGLVLLLWALVLIPFTVGAQSVLEGRVELPKTRTAPVMNKRYEIVTKGGVVAPSPPVAVIFLEGDFPKTAPVGMQQLIQKDFLFHPSILPVQTGTKVEFPNLDNAYHNVFSFSPTKRFDLGRYRPEDRPIPFQIFDKPGLITLRCDIHEHMRAIILVVDTPYFVLSDAEGRYRLTGLPTGRHVLKAWINSKTTLERAVDLGASGTQVVNLP